MALHTSSQTLSTASSLDRVLAISLATFSTFVVGYTATRVFLAQPAAQDTSLSTVVPHQASMWDGLGR